MRKKQHTRTHTRENNKKRNQPFCWRCHKLKQNVRKIATPTEKSGKKAGKKGFEVRCFFFLYFFRVQMNALHMRVQRQKQQRRQQMHACCTTNAAAAAATSTAAATAVAMANCN